MGRSHTVGHTGIVSIACQQHSSRVCVGASKLGEKGNNPPASFQIVEDVITMLPGPLLTKPTDVLPQDLVKSRSREIWG